MSDGAEMGALVGDVCWLCRETGDRRFEWFAGCSGGMRWGLSRTPGSPYPAVGSRARTA